MVGEQKALTKEEFTSMALRDIRRKKELKRIGFEAAESHTSDAKFKSWKKCHVKYMR